jgi:hypothetical protein
MEGLFSRTSSLKQIVDFTKEHFGNRTLGRVLAIFHYKKDQVYRKFIVLYTVANRVS